MEVARASALPPGVLQFVAIYLAAEFRHLYPEWDSAAAFDELCQDSGDGLPLHILMIENGEVLGVASIISDDEVVGWEDKSWWLANVLVLPEQRNRGIGKRLVASAIDMAKESGAHELHLVTNAAQDWYRWLGWQEVGLGQVHDHQMTVMRLALD